ncbi:hypothetical protein Plo01_66220 [Planobispora longispora]|uniref:Uncharacterized protein n=1 Tax=Planobispora longispora TaxID=28887 RepID=A0A8J3W8Y2_9ACTN|nr:hypothetical protein Plo01_66220 [Planobispora longispora]
MRGRGDARAQGGGEGDDRGVGSRAAPEGDAGAAAHGQRGEADASGRVGRAELRHQRHPLTDRDHRQDRPEVVDVVPDPRGEPGGLAGADGHRVAERARSGDDPGLVPAADERDARRRAGVPGPGLGVGSASRRGGRGAAGGVRGGEGGVGGVPGGEVHGLFEQGERVQGEVGLGGDEVVLVDQGHVQVAGAQAGGDLGGVDLVHHRLQGRVLPGQRRQGRGQDGAGRRGEGADPDGPAQVRPGGGQLGRGLLQPFQYGLRVPDQRDPRRGERHPAAGPLQQRHPGLPLQGGELLGDRRRSEHQRLGHRGDRAPMGEFAEQAEPSHIEHQISLTFGKETRTGPAWSVAVRLGA